MPNREFRERKVLEEFWPSGWMDKSELEQRALSRRFQNLLLNDDVMEGILKSFKPSNWERLKEHQKIRTCQILENTLAMESGRDPYIVIPAEEKYGDMVSGYTKKETKSISVNTNVHSSYDIVNTIVHEACHADQFELINKRERAKKDENLMGDYKEELDRSGLNERDLLVMNWEIYNYRMGEGYLPNTVDLKLHQMQLIETEAIFESTKFMRRYSSIMGDEHQFSSYLEKKEDELEELIESFREGNLVKCWFDDRKRRLNGTDMESYTDVEQAQLKSIFSQQDIGECGLKLFANLGCWQNKSKIQKVKVVTLEEMLGENREKKTESRERGVLPAKEKKTKSGLGL